MAEIAVRLSNLVKAYAGTAVIDNISLEVGRGEFFSLVGPSGCGKTTTLRSIAGLIEVDSGRIEIFGKDVTHVPIHRRNIGIVFQNYALFPHMTVARNIAFGLKMHRVPRGEIAERVNRVLDLVQLGGKGDRYPAQLSGGQQQRVALARAIVIEPQLLLLDEPLSNLDARLRKSMQFELRALQQRLGITAIYVTHDQEEALTLSDRIAVMKAGAISQIAKPIDIYRQPADAHVAQTIGRVNLIRGRIETVDGGVRFLCEGGAAFGLRQGADYGAYGDRGLCLAVRPENVRIDADVGNRLDGTWIAGRIAQAVYAGAITNYLVEIAGGLRLLAEEQNLRGNPRLRQGQEVRLDVDPEAVHVVTEDDTYAAR